MVRPIFGENIWGIHADDHAAGSADNAPFWQSGLAVSQFIQDLLEFGSWTYYSSMDSVIGYRRTKRNRPQAIRGMVCVQYSREAV
jgi:hypothetical protein